MQLISSDLASSILYELAPVVAIAIATFAVVAWLACRR